jgi:imidazolonepropionase-like amidohydrolase
MTRDEVVAVVDEAHRMGYRVAAHAEGLGGARIAVEEGVDTIEHGLSLHRAPELLGLMAERGTVLVPTLSTFADLADRFADAFSPRLVEQAKRQADDAHATLLAAHAAGVILAMGYDSGPPGASATELIRMAEAGIGTAAAIRAATFGSAQALGLAAEIGTVEVGRTADLLVLEGDPLMDPSILLDPARRWLVLQGGRPVAGEGMRSTTRSPE